jgi:hypothetical protein
MERPRPRGCRTRHRGLPGCVKALSTLPESHLTSECSAPDSDGDAQTLVSHNYTLPRIICKRRPQAELPKHVEHVPNVQLAMHEACRPATGQRNFKIKEPQVSLQSGPSLADFFYAASEKSKNY